jgi:hypothetical protein
LAVATLALAACGGGGGSGGTASTDTTPLVYSGITTAAQLTTTSAGPLAGAIVSSSSSAGAIAAYELNSRPALAAAPAASFLPARQIARSLRAALTIGQAGHGLPSPATGLAIDEVAVCDNGVGTLRLTGTLDDASGLGTLTATFSACLSAGYVLNGAMSMRIDAIDLGLLVPLDASFSLPRLSVAGPGIDGETSGNLRLQVDLAARRETLTMDTVARDRSTGQMTWNQNLVVASTYDNYPDGSFGGMSETLAGRIYDSRYGYLDVATPLPFRYEDVATQAFPVSGGVLLSGANGAQMRLRAMMADMCRISLDLSGTGFPVAEFSMLRWNELSGPAGADFGDTDDDGIHDSWESVHGLVPTVAVDAGLDADGDGATNIREYYVGADPHIADALPAFTPAVFAAPTFDPPADSSGGGSNPTAAVGVDLNGDGALDLVVANANSNQIAVRLGDGAGGFGSAVPIAVGIYPIAVAVGDFNGDTKADLAVANFGGASVTLLPGTGTGSFGAATTLSLPASLTPTDILVADFNNDAVSDLAITLSFGFSNVTPGSVSIWRGNGDGTFAAGQEFAVGGTPFSLATADFNLDGNRDLAVANALVGNVSVLLGDGAGSFGAASTLAVAGDYPRRVLADDFNRDGKPDLAAAVDNSTINNASINILAGDGTGAFGPASAFVVDASAGAYLKSLAVGDLNSDGKADLVIGNGQNLLGSYWGSIFLLFGDGAGSFGTTNYFVGLPAVPAAILVDDLDGDSNLDLIAAGSDPNAGAATVVSRVLNTSP